MTDIELVIKIDKETYKDIQNRDWKNGGRWYSEEWKAIHNGIPLPKGHGRLIDTNEITAFIELECNGHNVESLDEFTVIIEADGGDGE